MKNAEEKEEPRGGLISRMEEEKKKQWNKEKENEREK